MIDINQLDPASLATMSAIVAALVTVLGNAFNLPTRYRSLLAIGVAIILVFIPGFLLNKILTAIVIGLTASGVYSQVKPTKLLKNLSPNNTTTNAIQTLAEGADALNSTNTDSTKSNTSRNNNQTSEETDTSNSSNENSTTKNSNTTPLQTSSKTTNTSNSKQASTNQTGRISAVIKK